jgi:hypothetical protein
VEGVSGINTTLMTPVTGAKTRPKSPSAFNAVARWDSRGTMTKLVAKKKENWGQVKRTGRIVGDGKLREKAKEQQRPYKAYHIEALTWWLREREASLKVTL